MGFSIFAGEDAADQRYSVRRGIGESDGGFEEGERLGEHLFAGGIEGGDGLAFRDVCAAAGVEEDTGVGIDGLAGLFAACTGAPYGPADFRGVHL